MNKSRRIYMYPHTPAQYEAGSNDYIRNLVACLRSNDYLINEPTRAGMVDILRSMPKIDVLYFNWIEDLPHRKLGILQTALLVLVVLYAKLSNVKILWFVHNRISHSRKNLVAKKFIVWLMRNSADYVVSHMPEVPYKVPASKFYSFDHPMPRLEILAPQPKQFDILIWGTISPYKGVGEFIEYVRGSQIFRAFKILIAGKFSSEEYLKRCSKDLPENVTILNKMLSEQELRNYIATSKFTLFTYNPTSIQSSAALCKTLSFGKPIIGPNVGAFSELGRKRLILTFDSLADIKKIADEFYVEKHELPDRELLASYVEANSWDEFSKFICRLLSESRENSYIEATQLN